MNRAVHIAAFSAGLPLFAAVSFASETSPPSILKLSGNVDVENFSSFRVFLMNATGTSIGLDVSIAVDDTSGKGKISVGEGPEHISVTWTSEGYGTELYLIGDYQVQGDRFRIEGFYRLEDGGVHQGINSIGFHRLDETEILSSGPEVRQILMDEISTMKDSEAPVQ